MKKAWVLSYPLSAQRRLWSDWADAQAHLSLRWTHSHFDGFVMSRLILQNFIKIKQFSRSGLELMVNNSELDSCQNWYASFGQKRQFMLKTLSRHKTLPKAITLCILVHVQGMGKHKRLNISSMHIQTLVKNMNFVSQTMEQTWNSDFSQGP